jgi:hypothetical protein
VDFRAPSIEKDVDRRVLGSLHLDRGFRDIPSNF